VVIVLTLVQMGLGELQYRTHLPWGLVLAHVAVSAAVWSGTVALASLIRRPLRAT
jgi:heme A synthase